MCVISSPLSSCLPLLFPCFLSSSSPLVHSSSLNLVSFPPHFPFLSFYISYCVSFHSHFLLVLLSSFLFLVSSLTSFFHFLLSSSFYVLLILSSPLFSPLSAPGSGPMFRSTTVAVEPTNQPRPDFVQNWADIHTSSTTLGTSKCSYLVKKACAGVLNSLWACVCFPWWRYQSGFRGIKRSVVRCWNAETSLLTAT